MHNLDLFITPSFHLRLYRNGLHIVTLDLEKNSFEVLIFLKLLRTGDQQKKTAATNKHSLNLKPTHSDHRTVTSTRR